MVRESSSRDRIAVAEVQGQRVRAGGAVDGQVRDAGGECPEHVRTARLAQDDLCADQQELKGSRAGHGDGRGAAGRGDGELVVFDFPARDRARRRQAAGAAEAEAGVRVAGSNAGRHAEADHGRAGRNRQVRSDLLARIVPVVVTVEVDPGVELARSRRGDRGARAAAGQEGGVEDHAVFVVSAVSVVAGRVREGEAVGLRVDRGAQAEGGIDHVAGTVGRFQRRIGARRVAVVTLAGDHRHVVAVAARVRDDTGQARTEQVGEDRSLGRVEEGTDHRVGAIVGDGDHLVAVRRSEAGCHLEAGTATGVRVQVDRARHIELVVVAGAGAGGGAVELGGERGASGEAHVARAESPGTRSRSDVATAGDRHRAGDRAGPAEGRAVVHGDRARAGGRAGGVVGQQDAGADGRAAGVGIAPGEREGARTDLGERAIAADDAVDEAVAVRQVGLHRDLRA